jgi:hypothetical protein
MEEMRKQDWVNWLESMMQQELYIANEYITSEPSDYSSAQVPTLKTVTNHLPVWLKIMLPNLTPLQSPFFLCPCLPLVFHATQPTLSCSKEYLASPKLESVKSFAPSVLTKHQAQIRSQILF